mmetsp:Transcript_86852/g.221230  ORF Transcript_86852/g.221230 Transcript_86852/m.221230 type:complete len:119 (-) Transcript_86852:69-425(-)
MWPPPTVHFAVSRERLADEVSSAFGGGLPVLTQDLQWGSLTKLFVIGALAALQVGPDAGNLMGLRRAAHVVAITLDLRCWLKDTGSVVGNIRGNQYSALAALSDLDTDDDTTDGTTEL